LNDLLSALSTNVASVAGGKATSGELTSSGLSLNAASGFLNNQTYTSGKPKAYVNWVLLDEQFKAVITNDGKNSGFEQVQGSGSIYNHNKANWELTKSGYLYIYVSNETPNIDVFFDNLQVTHIRGPLIEESHYYPFGLTMAGISSQALNFGGSENKKKFQGQEFAHKEFSDGSGLEMYEFKWRMDDPQIGRFWQIDPLANDYVYNSPYAFSENKVTGHVELEGLESLNINTDFTKSMTPAERNKFWADYNQGYRDGAARGGRIIETIGIAALMLVQPEVGVPLALTEITGVPVTASPAALETTAASTAAGEFNAATGEGIIVPLEQRAQQIQGTLSEFTQTKTTTAVASATTSEGKNVTLVASSEKNLRPVQRAALQPGEQAVSGKGHAEQTIINHANANGMTVTKVAASRRICTNCAAAITNAGAQPASEIKKLNQQLVQQATLGKF
jgi:RHS repeat-associated protein